MSDFLVIYQAELLRKLTSRPFQIGLLIGVIGIYGFIELPNWISSATAGMRTVVLAGDTTIIPRARQLLSHDFSIAAERPGNAKPSKAEVTQHKDATWIVLSRTSPGLAIALYASNPTSIPKTRIATDLVPLNVELATHASPNQTKNLLTIPTSINALGVTKFKSERAADASQTIAFTLLFFLYLLITFNSQLLMSSVAEEKTSRIAELLVSSISPTSLLYGKIASSATLGAIQMVAWLAEAIILGHTLSVPGAHSAVQTSLGHSPTGTTFADIFAGSVTPLEATAFLLFFILGFLQLAMLFAGAGSLINRTEDLGSISFPLIVPVMAGFVISIIALNTPDATWVTTVSFIPLLAPFVMFARIAVSDVPIWQLVLSLVINTLTLWLIAVLAGKLYRVGMLLYGQPPSFRQVWSVITS